jgi:hypothetical protein
MSDDVAIVEEALGEALSPDSIEVAVRHARSVIPIIVDAWYPQAGHDDFPLRQPGELSYFVSGSRWHSSTVGQEMSVTYEQALNALLYAHRVVINSPLLMLSSAAMRGKSLDWCTDLLLTSLHLLHSLRDLIDTGIVVVIGSDANYDNPYLHYPQDQHEPQLNLLSQDPDLRELPASTRLKIGLALHSGCAVDIFADSDEEFQALQTVFGADPARIVAPWSDATHISALLDTLLPDASELDISEVVRIREDESFETWRGELRRALRQMILVDASPALSGEGAEEMQAIMQRQARELYANVSKRSSMKALRNHAATFAVAGVGAAMAIPIVGGSSFISETAMAAGSLGAGALSVGASAVARAMSTQDLHDRSIAHHYAFLGKCSIRTRSGGH